MDCKTFKIIMLFIYRVSQKKVSIKNFNSNLFITFIQSALISLCPVDLQVLFGRSFGRSIVKFVYECFLP